MVAFVSRLFLLWLSGWLLSSGWINDELQQMMLGDPAIADAIQVVISGTAMGAWWAWWRLAKRWGWAT